MNNDNCYNEYCNDIGNINNFNEIIEKKKISFRLCSSHQVIPNAPLILNPRTLRLFRYPFFPEYCYWKMYVVLKFNFFLFSFSQVILF